MLKIENQEIIGLQHAIRGIHNSINSWEKSDSGICKGGDNGIGCENCFACQCGHSFDHSFQVGCNDHELMTKLVQAGSVHGKFRRMITVYVDITAPLYWWMEFTLDDFSHKHLISDCYSDNKKRTVMLNYEVLADIYQYRKNHKLDEWREFCMWIEELPNSDIITCNSKNDVAELFKPVYLGKPYANWIPPNKELPEESQEVLVTIEMDNGVHAVDFAEFHKESGYVESVNKNGFFDTMSDWIDAQPTKVIAWMPKPKAYL